jgi:hypothetical protein
VWDTQLVLCYLRLASGLFVFFCTTNNLGVPGSSRGTLECNRVDLQYIDRGRDRDIPKD